MPRDPRAFRPVENRPLAHGTRALWRTWRCCLRGQRATRSTKCRWPRLFFTDTAPGRRLRLRKGRGHHMQLLWCAATMRFARGEQSDGPRSTRALETWRGCLRGRRATRSIPRRWPRHFFTDTAPGWQLRLRNVVITACNPRGAHVRALRPVENRPTAHGIRAHWRTWRGCLCGPRASRSTPRR